MQQVNHLEALVCSPPDGQRNSYLNSSHCQTTTPTSRISYASSLKLSSHSDMNASPITKPRNSQDIANKEALPEIYYPPLWYHQPPPGQGRESSTSGSDKSSEPHSDMTMVSLICPLIVSAF